MAKKCEHCDDDARPGERFCSLHKQKHLKELREKGVFQKIWFCKQTLRPTEKMENIQETKFGREG